VEDQITIGKSGNEPREQTGEAGAALPEDRNGRVASQKDSAKRGNET
jgi:hypothetical protein